MARAAWWLGGASALFLAVALRVVLEGRSELAASDVAWEAGNANDATVHARAAARAYVPFAPHVPRAYRRLRAIAQDREAKGDAESALFAWRAMRAAAIGSRSLLGSHARERELADAAIARLSARSTRSENFAADVALVEGSPLAADVPPRGGWALLLVAGAVLWVAAGVRLVSKAWRGDGTFRMADARLPIAMAAAGLVVWWAALFVV